MPEPQKLDPSIANLVGGPADGQTLHLRGVTTWREYVCVQMKDPNALNHHYMLLSGGVYEHGGACVEFTHSSRPAVKRCADCGCPIGGPGTHGH